MVTRTKSRQPKRDEGRSRAVTLEDVAQRAGVTAMTVSRVIKGTAGVGADTRERVLRIAEELNYTANLSARALATGKTGVIAVISGGLNQYYYANIVHLLETQLTSSGYQMRLLHTHSDVRDLIGSTSSTAVDGVIIVAKYDVAEEFRALAPQTFKACVFIDATKHAANDYVHCDLKPAVEEAVRLMIAAGRKRIAFAGHFDLATSILAPEERLAAYLAVIKREGRTPELMGPDQVLTIEILERYIREHGSPDAVLCVNDETAMYVYRALRDAGYRVPDDVLLVGCDGLPFMKCFDPPLSTIAQPVEEMCALAWQFLQARIANPGQPFQQATFDAQLIVRASLQNPSH